MSFGHATWQSQFSVSNATKLDVPGVHYRLQSATPILQRPLEVGAHLSLHAATKYIDGQGRVMGGVVVGA